MQPMNIIL